MATGFASRDRALQDVLRTIYLRLRRLENPKSIHLAGTGGAIGGKGFRLAVDAAGNLVAISDNGTSTTIALQ